MKGTNRPRGCRARRDLQSPKHGTWYFRAELRRCQGNGGYGRASSPLGKAAIGVLEAVMSLWWPWNRRLAMGEWLRFRGS
jgi:hypothetical protein